MGRPNTTGIINFKKWKWKSVKREIEIEKMKAKGIVPPEEEERNQINLTDLPYSDIEDIEIHHKVI